MCLGVPDKTDRRRSVGQALKTSVYFFRVASRRFFRQLPWSGSLVHLLLKNRNNEGMGIYVADRLLNDIAKAFEVRERQLRGESAANTADMQPDAQPTNRRINRHKTTAKLSTSFRPWGVPDPIAARRTQCPLALSLIRSSGETRAHRSRTTLRFVYVGLRPRSSSALPAFLTVRRLLYSNDSFHSFSSAEFCSAYHALLVPWRLSLCYLR